MPTCISFDETSGLIAAQRLAEPDPRAVALRRLWLIERTARDLMRTGGFLLAGRYIRKAADLAGDAADDPAIGATLAKSIGRRFVALLAEFDAKNAADLDAQADAILGGDNAGARA